MVCELVKVEQKVEELKGRLPSLLCNSCHDDCCSLTQRVASTIENCKQVSFTASSECTLVLQTRCSDCCTDVCGTGFPVSIICHIIMMID